MMKKKKGHLSFHSPLRRDSYSFSDSLSLSRFLFSLLFVAHTSSSIALNIILEWIGPSLDLFASLFVSQRERERERELLHPKGLTDLLGKGKNVYDGSSSCFCTLFDGLLCKNSAVGMQSLMMKFSYRNWRWQELKVNRREKRTRKREGEEHWHASNTLCLLSLSSCPSFKLTSLTHWFISDHQLINSSIREKEDLFSKGRKLILPDFCSNWIWIMLAGTDLSIRHRRPLLA